jgi:transposase InsO family protein
MIRDMMMRCVERRFSAIRAPHPVQWLSDNGSIFAAHRTIEIAMALNLVPCFTTVESPESNDMAEAFVKTFKRDYVRVSPVANATEALPPIETWMEDYNTVHPHSRLGYRSPKEYIMLLSQPATCPV